MIDYYDGKGDRMMKGLLVKDFRLLKVQKNFFLLIIAVAIGMALFTNDVAPMPGASVNRKPVVGSSLTSPPGSAVLV